MPIEFRCSVCGKLLRVADGAAGKQAKCPACQAVQLIPGASSPEDYSVAPAPDSHWQQNLPPAPREFADNPYAAPGMAGPAFAAPPAPSSPRNGPPWERDGATIVSYFATVKQFYFSPLAFFSQMRRRGGIGAPLGFAAVGSVIGSLVFVAFVFAISLLDPNGPLKEMPAQGPERAGYIGGLVFAFGCCSAVLMPLAILVYSLVAAGLFHACLLIFGAAKFPYETTLRVVAYAVGATMLIGCVPFCGFHISFVTQWVFAGIGLAWAQEASGAAAAAAVLLPALLCGGGGFILLLVLAAAAGG